MTLSTQKSVKNTTPSAILAIESSCDETAAAIYDIKTNTLLSNVVVSQIDIFKAYGGVIPELAARSHLEAILPVIDQAFSDAGLTLNETTTSSLNTPSLQCKSPSSNEKPTRQKNDWSKISAIAVTHTPGLLGSLLIGTLTARTLAIVHNKPLYPVHHLKSHIFSTWIPSKTAKNSLNPTPTPSFPLLALVISGGHTQIIRMTTETDFKIVGTTLDDAVGECFDKIAKILGLPYPGGPSISAAALGRHIPIYKPSAASDHHTPIYSPSTPAPSDFVNITPGDRKTYSFPHPKIEGLNFSFSGLKTAVLRSVQKTCGVDLNYPSKRLRFLLSPEQIANYAASFEETACDILLEKLTLALKQYPDTASVVFAGGVSANSLLREKAYSSRFARFCYFPKPSFSGDNAAMVALAAASEIRAGKPPCDPFSLTLFPRSPIS